MNDSLKEIEYIDVLLDIIYSISKSRYGDYFVFKGAVVLNLIIKNDKSMDDVGFRITRDVYADVNGKNIIEEFINYAENLLNNNSNIDCKYKINKVRGFSKNPNSNSIELLACTKNKDFNISIDMSNRDNSYYKSYSYKDSEFKGNMLESIIVDKLIVVCSDIVFRRIKDLFDLYVISYMSDIKLSDIYNMFVMKDKQLNKTIGFLKTDRFAELEHAYSKYVGIINKPDISKILISVSEFITPIISYIESNGKTSDKIWSGGSWHVVR